MTKLVLDKDYKFNEKIFTKGTTIEIVETKKKVAPKPVAKVQPKKVPSKPANLPEKKMDESLMMFDKWFDTALDNLMSYNTILPKEKASILVDRIMGSASTNLDDRKNKQFFIYLVMAVKEAYRAKV